MSRFDPFFHPPAEIRKAEDASNEVLPSRHVAPVPVPSVIDGDPASVFNPNVPPSKEMFVERDPAMQARLVRALKMRGRQLLIYGPTGVGKTSLVDRFIADLEWSSCEVVPEGTFEEFVRSVLAKVGVRSEITEVDTNAREAGLEAGVPGLLKSGGKGTHEHATTTTPILRSPQDQLLSELESRSYRALVIDNYENVNRKEFARDFGTSMSELLKLAGARAKTNPDAVKIIVIGIPEDARSLIALNDSAARVTAQIEVTNMTAIEVEEIIGRGAAQLRTTFDADVVQTIVDYSDGFPYLVHEFSYGSIVAFQDRAAQEFYRYLGPRRDRSSIKAATDAVTRTSRTISAADWQAALPQVVLECRLPMFSQITEAASSDESRAVLASIALAPKLEVSPEQLMLGALEFLKRDRVEETIASLGGALRDLIFKYRILREATSDIADERKYRFSKPLMRAFVWLLIRAGELQMSRPIGTRASASPPRDIQTYARPWVARPKQVTIYIDQSGKVWEAPSSGQSGDYLESPTPDGIYHFSTGDPQPTTPWIEYVNPLSATSGGLWQAEIRPQESQGHNSVLDLIHKQCQSLLGDEREKPTE